MPVGTHSHMPMPPYVFVENEAVTEAPTEQIAASEMRRKGGNGFWRAGAIAPHFRHIDVLLARAQEKVSEGALSEAAKMLVAAENPVIICDRMARTPAAMARLVELAETLQCAVVDQIGRLNFPSRHPLNHSQRDPAMIRREKLAKVVDGLAERFGDDVVKPASLLRPPD